MEFLGLKIEWFIASLVFVAVNYGVIKTQLKNKINRDEAIELIGESVDIHFDKCPNKNSSFSNVEGAVLQTKVGNIEKTCDIMTKDIKELLGRIPK